VPESHIGRSAIAREWGRVWAGHEDWEQVDVERIWHYILGSPDMVAANPVAIDPLVAPAVAR
jgi:hypothetical protein